MFENALPQYVDEKEAEALFSASASFAFER